MPGASLGLFIKMCFFIISHGGRAVRKGGTWAGMWVNGALAVPLMYPAPTPAHLYSHGVDVT